METMVTNYNEVHPKFKINGISCNAAELREIGYCLIKEGVPFENPFGDFLLDWLNDKPTISVKTSGSTGMPKTVLLRKEHMINSALGTAEFFGLEAGDAVIHCLPASYIAGKMMLVRAMVLGLRLDYVEPTATPLAGISKSYKFGAMVPLQLENSLDQVDQIKTLIVGGAPLSMQLRDKIQALDNDIYETYGMTETVSHVAIKKVSQNPDKSDRNFKVLPDIKIHADERGCLVIDAPLLSEEAVVTNDLVEIIDDHEFKWLGRYDNIINSGGVKLIPEEIESKLSSYLSTRFFVTGMPDEVLGEKLVLFVEGNGVANNFLEELKNKGSLQNFEIPKKMVSVAKFAETGNGKLDRNRTIELATV
ncbi:AMP-binding protein [Sediminicola sp. 1XM1-17]|uniref:AMP-binding protein n=1 Tax=Sediminicola sp. 1XM1-17 TaxID=3127702 RepID=UPI00307865D3